MEELKNSIIELYQNIKIRKESDTEIIDKDYLEEEKKSLSSISPKILIDYIKIHLNLLIDIKVSDKINKLKINPMDFISLYGSEIPDNDYEKLLRRYEGDIRNYIRLVNMLKIHIVELNEKQEILEKQIEQLQKETLNLIPTTQSIEYKKKIEELTALIKKYEKHNLKIPLLEKKIKIQKIELDKLDSYYKKQLKNYTKKIEDYEKELYLSNLNNNNHNNSTIKKTKIIKSGLTSSIYYKKSKNRMNSNSPKKENKSIKVNRYGELKTIENDKNSNIKKTKSINNIFFKLKNNEIKRRIEENININLNINNNINGGNLYINSKQENSKSPDFEENKIMNTFYDSIETEKDNKTINIAGTVTNFRKKINLKTNDIMKKYNTNKDKYKEKEKDKRNNTAKNQKTYSRKKANKINSNRMSLKIPKNIPDHINTSKYIHLKEKNIPKINRYNSLKQLTNGKNKSTLNQSSKNENEQFNKTFSKIPCINQKNINIGNYIKNSNQSQRKIKNFILNKININNNNNNTMVNNGRTPIPIQRAQSKTHSFIK